MKNRIDNRLTYVFFTYILIGFLNMNAFNSQAQENASIDIGYADLPVEVQQKMDQNKQLGQNYYTDIWVSFDVELKNLLGEDLQVFKTNLEKDLRIKEYTLNAEATNLVLTANASYTIRDIAVCTYPTQAWIENYSTIYFVEQP